MSTKIDGEKVLNEIVERINWAAGYEGNFWEGYRFAMKILSEAVETEVLIAKSRGEWKGEDNA